MSVVQIQEQKEANQALQRELSQMKLVSKQMEQKNGELKRVMEEEIERKNAQIKKEVSEKQALKEALYQLRILSERLQNQVETGTHANSCLSDECEELTRRNAIVTHELAKKDEQNQKEVSEKQALKEALYQLR